MLNPSRVLLETSKGPFQLPSRLGSIHTSSLKLAANRYLRHLPYSHLFHPRPETIICFWHASKTKVGNTRMVSAEKAAEYGIEEAGYNG